MKQILILAFTITILMSCENNTAVNNDIQVSSKNVVLDKPVKKLIEEPVEMIKTTGSFIERYDNENVRD